MKTLTITHTGFHGTTTVKVRVPDNPDRVETHVNPAWPYGTDEPEYLLYDIYPISARVARRIDAAACGMATCKCYERIADCDGSGADARYSVSVPHGATEAEYRGHYARS